MLIASTDGFARWAKPSEAAFKSGRYLKTRNEPFEMPERSLSSLREFTDESLKGVRRTGVWFGETVIEMCMRTDRYDMELTLLHFEGRGPAFQSEQYFEDTYTRFFASN
jgi:hypothetical protein